MFIEYDLWRFEGHPKTLWFSFYEETLSKTVYRLSENILFLSNISEIHVECASHNFTNVIHVQKPQIMFSVQCDCRIIFDTILHCSSVSNYAEF